MTNSPGTNFVVREGGRWWLTVAGEDAPSVLSFDDLLAVIDASDVDPPETDPVAAVAPLDDDTYLTPAWSFVGAVTHTGLVTETATGATVVFDTDDLAVLDAITDPAPVTDITRRSGITDAPQRLARLAATAKIRVLHPEPAGTPTPTTDTPATRPTIAPTGTPDPGGAPGRIPVYAIWHPDIGPLLSLGMLTAAARAHPHLTDTYEIRRPETADSFLADLAGRTGPAILLCSDYVWSLTHNLDTARQAITINPQLLVIHGGPSSPKYPDDATTFLHTHAPIAHLLTRGEGEHLITELLTTLAPALTNTSPDQPWPPLPDTLTDITGLTYTHPTTRHTIRTPDRPRIADLDTLPSPYLTGEFDHIPGDAWTACLVHRDQPRLPLRLHLLRLGLGHPLPHPQVRPRPGHRRDPVGRRPGHPLPEPDRRQLRDHVPRRRDRRGASPRSTGAHRGPASHQLHSGEEHHQAPHPDHRHPRARPGWRTTASISLQTQRPRRRSTPSTARTSRPTTTSPSPPTSAGGACPSRATCCSACPARPTSRTSATSSSSSTTRSWPAPGRSSMLPNAPMNDPDYRARHHDRDRRRSGGRHRHVHAGDRRRMLTLREAEIVFERYGVLRHVLRWLQWDHDLPATRRARSPHRHHHHPPRPLPPPHLAHQLLRPPPHRPHRLDRRLRRRPNDLTDEHGIQPDTALDTVLTLQHALMPTPGRTFPHTIQLAHDYVTYYRDATTTLYTTGHAGTPTTPLHDHPPTTFTITADPLHLCDNGLHFASWGPNDLETDFSVGANAANELASPLLRLLPHVAACGVPAPWLGPEVPATSAAVPVAIGNQA